MATITLPEELVEQLESLAQRQNRSVVEVIASMVAKEQPAEEEANGWDAIFGIYDDNITDMSTTVRETMQKYYKEKYGDSD